MSLAVSPLPYDKIAVEVVELDDIARVFCRTLRVGERPPAGFPPALKRSSITGSPEYTYRGEIH
jgi:hypothetical protein